MQTIKLYVYLKRRWENPNRLRTQMLLRYSDTLSHKCHHLTPNYDLIINNQLLLIIIQTKKTLNYG